MATKKANKEQASKQPKKSNGKNNQLELIKRLIRAKGETLLAGPNITSLGIGHKITNGKKQAELSLQFSVEQKLQPQDLSAQGVPEIPKTISFEGVDIPTDVLQRSFQPSYETVAIKAKTDRKTRRNPIQPGISIANANSTAGTLGAIAWDPSGGSAVILSNWHVLNGPTGKIGDRIVQPGPYDDNRKDQNLAGHLMRSHLGLAGDCAIASIEGRKIDAGIADLGVSVQQLGKPELGDLVAKSGRTTEVTYGIVSRIEAIFKMPYTGLPEPQTISGFEIEPTPAFPAPGNEISKGGDSGAAWMALDKNKKVTSTMLGLHFGGDADGSDGEFALACYASNVFQKLEIEPMPTVAQAQALAKKRSPDAADALRTGFDIDFLDFSVPRPTFTKNVGDDLIGLYGENCINYCHYTAWLSMDRKLPVCVAWNIDGSKKKSLSRKGISFVKDDREDLAQYQLGDELYSNNDLDRGHVARRDDLVWGTPTEADQANRDSFFFTNMTPQHQAFNQSKLKGKWGLLENAILDEVDLKDLRVSVFGGPILSSDDPVYRGAKLPREFWKAVFFTDDEDGEQKARAFILTQADLINELQPESLELKDFQWYQVPLATIQKRTGVRFATSLAKIDTKFQQALGVPAARLVVDQAFFV